MCEKESTTRYHRLGNVDCRESQKVLLASMCYGFTIVLLVYNGAVAFVEARFEAPVAEATSSSATAVVVAAFSILTFPVAYWVRFVPAMSA